MGGQLKAVFRFTAWVAAASGLAAITAPSFPALLNQMLGDTFGSTFAVVPFVALFAVTFAFRWRDLEQFLNEDGGFETLLWTRLAGVSMLVSLVALEPLTGIALETSAVAVVLTFFGASLAINPLTSRFLLPYAAVLSVGVSAPSALQWAFGAPLASLSSVFSANLVGFLGVHVAWQGTQFQFMSRTGEVISAVVTPDCSGIVSVTTFLGLLALMHVDMHKDLRSTASLALVGTVALAILNCVRIMLLIWAGYAFGSSAFWGLHYWLGYAEFLCFYLAALLVYSRMGRQNPALYPANSGFPYTPS
jgi:exosortase/archaeosortase family protein